jgi:hypothetical protein
MSKYGIRVQGIREVIKSTENISQLFKFGSWLVSKGYVIPKALTTIGFQVGKGFVTWEVINAMFTKYCKTFSISDLDKTEYWVLQQLSALGPYFQPLSSPCPEMETKLAIKNTIDLFDTEEKIRIFLNNVANKGIQIGKQKGGTKSDIANIQFILYHLNIAYDIPVGGNADIMKKYEPKANTKKWNKEQCLSAQSKVLVGGTDMQAMAELFVTHPECNQYIENDGRQKHFSSSKWDDLDKDDLDKYALKKFTWGVFDLFTENMVKELQKRYELKVTGIFDSSTAKKVLDLLEDNQLRGIKEYVKFTTTDAELDFLKKKSLEEAKRIESHRTHQEKEIIKEMNTTSFETKKQEILDKVDKYERQGYSDHGFGDASDDTITEDIGNYLKTETNSEDTLSVFK